jgi:transcriptional regulator with XRE-family HTH domain
MDGRALVAWNIRRIRVSRGISQERLAFDSGIDRAYVGGIERQTQNPTIDILDRLAVTLEVHLSELFIEPKQREKKSEGLKRGRRPLAD